MFRHSLKAHCFAPRIPKSSTKTANKGIPFKSTFILPLSLYAFMNGDDSPWIYLIFFGVSPPQTYNPPVGMYFTAQLPTSEPGKSQHKVLYTQSIQEKNTQHSRLTIRRHHNFHSLFTQRIRIFTISIHTNHFTL